MREPQRHIGILLSQQERVALLFVQRFHDAKDLFHKLRRKAHAWLIQEDCLRARHQRPTNRDHLLLSA